MSAIRTSSPRRSAWPATAPDYEWIAGLYYFTEDKEEALGLPAINFGGAFNIFATNKTDAWAGFGELTWHFSDRLDGIVGRALQQ